jgi:hypothetical protein
MEKYYSIAEKIYDFSIFTYLLPVVIAIWKWRFFNLPLKVLGLISVRALIITWLAMLFYYIKYDSRMLYYISPCTDIIMMSILFTTVYPNNKIIKYGLISICSFFILFMFYDFVFGNAKQQMNPYLTSFETLFVIVLLLIMFRKFIAVLAYNQFRKSMLWLLAALLIGNLFSILFTTFSNSIQSYSLDLYKFIIYITSPFILIMTNVFSVYGFYIVKKYIQ